LRSPDASITVVAPGLTPGLLEILGAKPLLGRTFVDAEGQSGGPKAVILSEHLWRESFHSDPAILSKTVEVNGQPRSVVGVMPRSFRFPEAMGQDVQKGLWLPLQPTKEMLSSRGGSFFIIVGQLQPNATLPQLRSELNATAQHIRQLDSKAT